MYDSCEFHLALNQITQRVMNYKQQMKKVSKKKPRLFLFFNAKIPQKLLNKKKLAPGGLWLY